MSRNWINAYSTTPKYKQLANSVISEIEAGTLKSGAWLPSVNKLIIKYSISRDTVVKAYEFLKSKHIVDSVPGKGYFIKNTNFKPKARVLLLFNKLSVHKHIIYDSFVKNLGEDIPIDFFIYNNDFQVFKKLIQTHSHELYTHIVLIAHFVEAGDYSLDFLKDIPENKLVILDKRLKGFEHVACVYQDFEKDLFEALEQALPALTKYKRLKIIFPSYHYHPKEILLGFERFCDEYAFERSIVRNIESESIEKGEAYINLIENDLVCLIKRIKNKNFIIGKEIGIVSYNDTPLKELLLDGITVMSTDFEKLGQTAAGFVLKPRTIQIANPFRLILRKSL